MIAITPGDVVAVEPDRFTIVFKGEIGAVTLQVVGLNVFCFIKRCRASGGACLHQIPRHFGLAVYHDFAAAGQFIQCDPHAAVIEHKLKTVMG